MFPGISKWCVELKKSYVEFVFNFDTAEEATAFYETARSNYEADKDKLRVRIYAVLEEEE